jgi:hypothetical protein
MEHRKLVLIGNVGELSSLKMKRIADALTSGITFEGGQCMESEPADKNSTNQTYTPHYASCTNHLNIHSYILSE